MSKGSYRFREAEVTRALNGAKKAGLEIAGIEIDATGKITVLMGRPVDLPASTASAGVSAEDQEHWDQAIERLTKQ